MFARSNDAAGGYDAVGLWAHVQDMTHNLWRRVRAVVAADVEGNDQAALHAALPVADETKFLDSWGSSAFDLPSATTPDWRMDSPLDGRYYPSTHAPTAVDSSSTFTLAPWSTTQLSIGPGGSGPLIEIHLDQAVHARFGVAENYVDSEITSRIFCTAASTSECQCPAGDTGAVPATTPLPGEPDLGAAADAIGGSLIITYLTPANSGYCEPEKPKPAPLPGPISCKNLLPGYDPTVEGEFKAVFGLYESEPLPTETEKNGNYNSLCFFEGYKGVIRDFPEPEFKPTEPDETAPLEPVFYGVIATGTFTERTTSVALAQQDFAIRAATVGGASIGVGEESRLSTIKEETNKYGFKECGSTGVVRVQNEVAGFAIGGLASEACGGGAQQLLAQIAGEL